MKDWKSTVAAILSGIIGTLTGIMTYQVPAALLTPAQAHTWLWLTVVCNIVAISLRVWVGVLTNNADATAVAGAINNVAQAGPAAAPVTPEAISKAPSKTAVLMLVGAMALCLPLAGCKAASSPAGPTASTPYQRAATFMLDFSQDVRSAQQTEINLYKGGAVPAATHKAIEQAFAQVGQYGPQIDALLAAQASSATVQAKVNAALDALTFIIDSVSAIDPTTRAQITTSVQLVEQVLNNVVAQLKTVAEVDFGPEHNRFVSRARAGYRLADLQPDQVGGSGFSAAAGRDSRGSGREFRGGGEGGCWRAGRAVVG